MKIKVKLAIGTTVLFLLILTLGIVGTLFINRLATDSGKIIKDNYASLGYIREMQKALDKMQSLKRTSLSRIAPDSLLSLSKDKKQTREMFEKNLTLQQKNITEAGEKEMVEEVSTLYNNYLGLFSDANPDLNDLESRYILLNEKLNDILNINMGAMNVKNTKAKDTAERAIFYISVVGALTIIFALLLAFNFPGYIANPLIEIKDKIKEIANKNYDQRLTYKSNDELGELAAAFNIMAGKLSEYEQSNVKEIQLEKTRIESIVKNLDEGIILLDKEKKIKVINPAALSLLKLSNQETLEKYAPDIAIKNDLMRELIKNLTDESAANGNILKLPFRNEENYFKKEIFRVEKEKGKVIETAGYIISIRNITEFKKLDLAKTNFIAIISHELKTPIASINLSLKLLNDERIGKLNEEQTKLVGSVKDETLRLSRITGELLDISQVETGNIKLNIEEVNAEDIIKYSLEVIKPHVIEKNIQLIPTVSKNLPALRADLEKTVWVMTNLLANAVRYSPENGVIRIELHHSLKDLQFSVEDTGPGIEPENTEKIFKRFVQLGEKRQKEGVGLGLAISKEFIEKQGGKIWVQSQPGVGSKFIFTLPVA
ncbi:MAG: HAMP domain-containing protein [Cytophagaceae bacterium]|nr:HAMP domain-containing protein [Cytophagaceae bacterium]